MNTKALQPQTNISTDDIESIQPSNVPVAIHQKYLFEKKLGKGSQGEVWLANRKPEGEKVALKRLNIHSATTWKQYDLFKREAEILSSLDVQGVAPFIEYIEDLSAEPPYVCIVQKYIEGKTLGEWLKEKHRFESHVVYDIILQVLNILQQLHTHKPPVIHRDIKPSNLMLTPLENGKFQVTLLDFGAVANPQVQNGGSTVAGTFGYMPPEQLMGQAQPASDIYALAAVAVQMLTGIAPADIETCDFKLVIEPHLTHIPKEVVNTLSWMLEPALENRIADHHALIAQFSNLVENKPASLMKFVFKTGTPKLENVEHICQPGNYNIWQDFDAQKASQIDFHAIDKRFMHQNKPVHNNLNRKIILYCFLLLLFFSLSIFLIPHIQSILSMAAFVQLGMIALMGWGLKSLYQTAKLNRALKKLSSNIKKIDAKVHANKWLNVQNLLRNGQKFVGKITHIYYVSSASQTVSTLKSARQCILTPDEIPKFYIVYTFKMPFQGHIYEFHANMVTYHAPEHRYKVGDLMTLIANLSTDKNAPHELSICLEVMPYPYPFGDVRNESDILFKQIFNPDVLEEYSQEQAIQTAIQIGHKTFQQNDKNYGQNHYKMAVCLGNKDILLSLGQNKQPIRIHPKTSRCEIEKDFIFWAEHAFGQGYSKAAHQLAVAYEELGDYFLAEVWFYKSFTAGFHQTYEQCAKMHIAELFLTKAEDWYQMAFDIGITQASIQCAEMYQHEHQYQKAEEWYRTAFETGIQNAALLCAEMYQHEHQYQKAEEWYEKAFDAGITDAALTCANMYKKEHNFRKAEEWYEKAFDAGITEAALTCVNMYKKEHNFRKAEEWYEKAFDAGITDAALTCANMYKKEYKFSKAEEWYEKAFDAGIKEAAVKCAEMYKNEKQFDKAEIWYQIAFKAGIKEAAVKCAEMYKNEKQFDKAEIWYQNAFEPDIKEAAVECAQMYKNEKQFDKAEKWYVTAFDAGMKQAAMMCAEMHQIDREYVKAENWYKVAFSAGIHQAAKQCFYMFIGFKHFIKAKEWIDITQQANLTDQAKTMQEALHRAESKYKSQLKPKIDFPEDYFISSNDVTTNPYLDAQNYPKAFKYYSESMPKADAARKIGDFCRHKHFNTLKEIQTALYWYKEAYDYGALDLAQTIMFIYYFHLKDKKSAIQWYKKSSLYTSKTQLSDEEILKNLKELYFI